MPALTQTASDATTGEVPDHKRGWALLVIAVAQLMIVLDASVVIVALPSAQRALHISVADRQWVMTAYTLAFGSLLLLGGRIADYLGRRRMFIIGLLGFAAASALGGLAQSEAMLFGACALQGAFAALMAPSALSLLTVTFTEAEGAGPGLRGLRGHGRQRRGDRAGARRRAHPVRLVALDPAHQRAHRGRGGVCRLASSPRAGATTGAATTCRVPSPSPAGCFLLVYGFTTAALRRLGRAAHRRPAGRWRPSC